MNFLELIWHDHIRYFAISNVESSDDLKKYVEILPNHITIVPKIESPAAVDNIQDIVNALPSEKFLMLDHDDLFSSFIFKNKNINQLIYFLILLIISQNLSNYDFPIPKDAVYRINLAWVNSLDDFSKLLSAHSDHKIFIDLPIGRTKPPHNSYTFEELIPILQKNTNVKYLAISNVNSSDDLKIFIDLVPKHVELVPKIESPEGVANIENIVNSMNYSEKVIMLDHDDLFSALIKKGESPLKFKEYINLLQNFCFENNVTLLRTIGVVFSDMEKRETQYMN